MITLSDNAMNKPRKHYAKPRIAIEEFTHNQFIANNCSVNAHKDGWLETLRTDHFFDYIAVVRGKWFVDELDCANHVDSDTGTEDMDNLCYHTSSSPLFGS